LSGSLTGGGSFDALYRQHQPSLVRYVLRLTGDSDVAEDVAQEAFMRLLRRPDLGDEGARLWLFTVATNLIRDRGRAITRQQRLLAGASVAVGTPEPLPDEAAERSERVATVRQALELLSARDRQILLMREEGFRYDEIAEAIGVAPSSVGTLIARALKRFAKAYRTDENEDESPG
jgi:RNA polymerase sigma-70 factor, ECF subfamily